MSLDGIGIETEIVEFDYNAVSYAASSMPLSEIDFGASNDSVGVSVGVSCLRADLSLRPSISVLVNKISEIKIYSSNYPGYLTTRFALVSQATSPISRIDSTRIKRTASSIVYTKIAKASLEAAGQKSLRIY